MDDNAKPKPMKIDLAGQLELDPASNEAYRLVRHAKKTDDPVEMLRAVASYVERYGLRGTIKIQGSTG